MKMIKSGDGVSATSLGRRFYTVAEASALLADVSEPTLYRAIRAGEFPAIKIRGRYVIPARAIDAMEDAALAGGGVVDTADWTAHRGAA